MSGLEEETVAAVGEEKLGETSHKEGSQGQSQMSQHNTTTGKRRVVICL
jgi:hypothetical protein